MTDGKFSIVFAIPLLASIAHSNNSLQYLTHSLTHFSWFTSATHPFTRQLTHSHSRPLTRQLSHSHSYPLTQQTIWRGVEASGLPGSRGLVRCAAQCGQAGGAARLGRTWVVMMVVTMVVVVVVIDGHLKLIINYCGDSHPQPPMPPQPPTSSHIHCRKITRMRCRCTNVTEGLRHALSNLLDCCCPCRLLAMWTAVVHVDCCPC